MFKHPITRSLFWILLAAAGIPAFSSCDTEAKKKEISSKETYIIPDTLVKNLSFDSVKKGQLINATTLTGQVDFNQDKQVNIFSLVSGNIQDIKVQLGDYVTQGQTLAVVKSSEMAGYSNNLTIAETNLISSKKQLDATQALYKSGLASILDVTNAQTNYAQAQAQVAMVKRVLKINGNDTSGDYRIKSPINGFIVQKFATNAQSIRPDNANPLFTISDLKNVWVWANVYESNVDKIKMGDNVEVTTLSFPDRVFKGKVDKIMHVLDPGSKVMKIRAVIENPGYALKPLMFASVTATNTRREEATYIPSSALVFDHSQYYVLVYHGGGRAEIRPVEKAGSYGNKVYIGSGVNIGDTLISSRTLQIYDQLNN